MLKLSKLSMIIVIVQVIPTKQICRKQFPQADPAAGAAASEGGSEAGCGHSLRGRGIGRDPLRFGRVPQLQTTHKRTNDHRWRGGRDGFARIASCHQQVQVQIHQSEEDGEAQADGELVEFRGHDGERGAAEGWGAEPRSVRREDDRGLRRRGWPEGLVRWSGGQRGRRGYGERGEEEREEEVFVL